MTKGWLLLAFSFMFSLEVWAKGTATFEWSGVVPYRTYSEYQEGYRLELNEDKRRQPIVLVFTTLPRFAFLQAKI